MSWVNVMLARHDELWAALSTVVDPELDQAVTDLGFITRCEIDPAGRVDVAYRLPTYWCAANFAFMMGQDMVEAIDGLSWPTSREVTLLDHFYADEINRGLADDADFQTTCGDEATGDLTILRATFRHKAFMARQERLLDYLLRAGWPADDVVGWSVHELADVVLADRRGERLRSRYLAMRRERTPGDFSDRGYRGDRLEPAFVTATGQPLTPATLAEHRRRLRSIRNNSEFNASLCSSVLAARKREAGRIGQPERGTARA